MTDFISDLSPTETPIAAANEGYAQINPGFGAFAGATLRGGPSAFLGRAAERGQFEGSSPFDQGAAQIQASGGAFDQPLMVMPQPAESPMMEPDDYNRLYAPLDANGKKVSLGDKPMPEALAKVIGQQKSEAMARDSAIARFSEAHSLPVNLLAGTVASLADPINLGLTFLPPLGEGAIAGNLARIGVEGLAGRALARIGAGAATGALTQIPITGLEMGLAPEEASEVSLGDAFRNVAYGAAGFAAMHAVGGAVGDLLRRPEPIMPSPSAPQEETNPADAARAIITAPADVNRAAMQSAVSQIAGGRPVEAAPFFYRPPTPDTALGSAVPLPSPEADQLRAQQARLRTLIDTPPEQHPSIVALDQQLDALRVQRLEAPPAQRPALATQIAQAEELRRAAVDEVPTQIAAARQQLQQIDYRLRDLAYTPTAANFAAAQDRLFRDGFASGIPADDFAATQDAVYGSQSQKVIAQAIEAKKPEAAQPPAARAEPPEVLPATQIAKTPEQAPTAPAGAPGEAAKPEVIGREEFIRDFTDKEGTDLRAAADALTSRIKAALDEGHKVTLYADGKAVPIVDVVRGMMADAKGQRWGTMGLATDKGGGNRVEIGPKESAVVASPEAVNAAEGAKPPPGPYDAELAKAEADLARVPQEHLSVEDQALLKQTETGLAAAHQRADAAEVAGQCLSERLP